MAIVCPPPAPPIVELSDADVENDVIELVSIKHVDVAAPPTRAVTVAPPLPHPPPPTFVIASVMHGEPRQEESTPALERDHFETNVLRRGHIKRRLLALGLVAAVVLACPWAASIAREGRVQAVAVNAVGATIAPLATATPIAPAKAAPAKAAPAKIAPAKVAPAKIAPAKSNAKVAKPRPK